MQHLPSSNGGHVKSTNTLHKQVPFHAYAGCAANCDAGVGTSPFGQESGGLSHLRDAVAASAGLLALHLLTLKQLEAGGGDLQHLTLISQQQGQQSVADLAAAGHSNQPCQHKARRAAQVQVKFRSCDIVDYNTPPATILRPIAALLCRQSKAFNCSNGCTGRSHSAQKLT